MSTDPHAPSPDALLDEAITDLILQATKSEWGDSPALLAAEGRLRAAVRRLAEQGEVYEVCDKDFMDEHPFGRCVALLLKGTTFEPEPGTRVRVTRIEEAP